VTNHKANAQESLYHLEMTQRRLERLDMSINSTQPGHVLESDHVLNERDLGTHTSIEFSFKITERASRQVSTRASH
jgi:hypothetical protein